MTTIDPKGTFTDSNGIICVRFIKTFANGKTGYHRTSIQPGQDAAHVIAAVNTHLAEIGAGQCQDFSSVTALVQTKHTAEVITAFAALQVSKPADIIKRDEAAAAVQVDLAVP